MLRKSKGELNMLNEKKINKSSSKIKKILAGVICVVVLSFIVYGGEYLLSVQKYKNIIKDIKISNVDLKKVHDGKYIGSFDAIYVGAEVSVTVKDHKIINITLLKNKTVRGQKRKLFLVM